MALVPSIGLLFCIRSQEKTLAADVRTDFRRQAQLTSAQVDSWTGKILLTLRQDAFSERIISMDPKAQTPVLIASARLPGLMVSSFRFFTLDLDGNVVARSDDKALKNHGDRTYFRDIIAGKEFGQQVLVKSNTQKTALCLSVPIKAEGLLVGVLAACSNLVDISEAISDIQIGKTGFAFLVNKDKRVIAHGSPSSKLDNELQDFSNHPIFQGTLANHQSFATYKDQNRDVIALKQPIGLGWTLVVQQDVSEAFSMIEQMKHDAVILIALTSFFTVIAAYFFVRVSLSNSNLELQISERTSALVRANRHLKAEVSERIQAEKDKERLIAELDYLSHTDGLTTLHNRRSFDMHFSQEWQRHGLSESPLTLIICDIDYFKNFNDTYGHQAGDVCIKNVALALKRKLKRVPSLAARYGGEEFAIILPKTGLERAIALAKGLRKSIEVLDIPHATSQIKPIVSMTFGVATLIPTMEQSPEDLIALADKALYNGKSKGRDQVSSWV
ncbi:MAG: diguanylate cyclase [Cyanobacteria bacterium P01_C01_bin.89]